MITLKRILVPTDFSDYSKGAITYACELAQRFGADLKLLHVGMPPVTPVPFGPTMSDQMFQTKETAKKAFEELDAPGLDRVSRVDRVLRIGTPFVEIVRYAREDDIDLIVMGTHGHTGLVHALIGSVAEKVVRMASCPVLTIRPKGHQFVMP